MSRTMPSAVAHADWSKDGPKRWVATARRQGTGWLAEGVRRVGVEGTLREKLWVAAGPGPVVMGFDFPIGVPRWWAGRVDITGFRQLLESLADKEWTQLLLVADKREEINLRRPFFPRGTAQAGDKQALLDGLGAPDERALLRTCELKVAGAQAAPLFLTMGQRQVGKAAIAGWGEVLVPALKDKTVRLWPFDGPFWDLVHADDTVIVETYPRRFYPLLAPELGSKRVPEDRAKQTAHFLHVCAGIGVEVSPDLKCMIQGGFRKELVPGLRSDGDGEDPFDAVIGLIGMLHAISADEPPPEPDDPTTRELEGWMFGQALEAASPALPAGPGHTKKPAAAAMLLRGPDGEPLEIVHDGKTYWARLVEPGLGE